MSRAFVNEDHTKPEPPPEKVVSPHRNLVTPAGLAQMDAKLAELNAALATISDQEAIVLVQRDLRYWRARRATAEIGPGPDDAEEIGFGSTVILKRDGKIETLQIVGEDEAEPALGKLSWVSPLARALMGLGEGDEGEFGGRVVEVIAVKNE
jgi:transcription elongation GreA/GreB family factor